MYSTKEKALEALKHCINLGDPFNNNNCGAGCPLWNQCTGQDLDVILSDLYEVMLDIGFPAERTEKIYDAVTRCRCIDMCDGCPYFSRCEGTDQTYLFQDIYDLLNESGVYEN